MKFQGSQETIRKSVRRFQGVPVGLRGSSRGLRGFQLGFYGGLRSVSVNVGWFGVIRSNLKWSLRRFKGFAGIFQGFSLSRL